MRLTKVLKPKEIRHDEFSHLDWAGAYEKERKKMFEKFNAMKPEPVERDDLEDGAELVYNFGVHTVKDFDVKSEWKPGYRLVGAGNQMFKKVGGKWVKAPTVIDRQKDVIESLLDEQGMMVLYAVPWPPQGLYTTKEIRSVDDLAGLKFRTYNSTLEEFVNLAGAAPTQVEVPDIPQAFSTGRVEAMITSPSTGANSQAWDFLSHYTDIQAWIPKNIVVVNKRSFQRLDEETQQAVLDAAAAAETRGWEMSQKETDEQTAVLEENGITIVEPSEELMTGLREIGEQMLANWKEEAGEDGAALLDAYQQ